MVELRSSQLSVGILPKGAELCSVTNQAGTQYLWQALPDVWPRHAPVLFPVVGRLKNDSYSYSGASYSLGQHGFARDLVFDLVEQTDSACTFELRSNAASREKYPFDFVLRIGYALSGNTLTSTYTVQNPSASPLLFSLGAHPGFSCPILPNERFEDHYLQFEGDHYQLTRLSGGLRLSEKEALSLTDGKLFLHGHLFDNDALVFEGGQIDAVSLCSSQSGSFVKLSCPGWPYFGIWSKKGSRDYVCLEPWYGIADRQNTNGQLAEKDGILSLAPKSEFSCAFGLQFG